MSVPAELRYTAEHEWVSIAGETVTHGRGDEEYVLRGRAPADRR